LPLWFVNQTAAGSQIVLKPFICLNILVFLFPSDAFFILKSAPGNPRFTPVQISCKIGIVNRLIEPIVGKGGYP
jgi:hypothetical protein